MNIEICNYRYPTSSCMNPAVSVKFQVDYYDKIYRVPRCRTHDCGKGYNTEEEATAAVITSKLSGENY